MDEFSDVTIISISDVDGYGVSLSDNVFGELNIEYSDIMFRAETVDLLIVCAMILFDFLAYLCNY